jgi:hypothetical protein
MYRKTRRGEVNLQDCLMMLVVLLAGLFIASYGAKHFGWLGFLLGVPVGIVVAFGVLYGVLLLGVVVESLIWGGIPYLPPCRNGKCKSGRLSDFGDYEPAEHNGEWGGYFRCRCGKLYHRDKKKGRVLEVLPDGAERPYMVWKAFWGWRPDGVGTESGE